MNDILDSVEEFHKVFELPVGEKPRIVPHAEAALRYNLMYEENEEYLEAALKNDLIGIADALGDQLYVLAGTMLVHGLQHKIVEVFQEIHRSNMSKLGEDGKPIRREDGKVLKGPDYFKPNIEKILS